MRVWARSESPGADAWHAARLRASVPRSGLGSDTCAWACARAAREALPERIRVCCAVLRFFSERALLGRTVHRLGILAATICYLSDRSRMVYSADSASELGAMLARPAWAHACG